MGKHKRARQVTFYLPHDLSRALKIRAAELDDSVSALLERGARLVLRETEARGAKKRSSAEDAIGVGAVRVEPRPRDHSSGG